MEKTTRPSAEMPTDREKQQREHKKSEMCERLNSLRVFSFLKNICLFFTVEVGKRSCGCDLQCTVRPEIRIDVALLW